MKMHFVRIIPNFYHKINIGRNQNITFGIENRLLLIIFVLKIITFNIENHYF